MNPMLMALQGLKGGMEEKQDETMMNPASSTKDGEVVFLPKSMYEGKATKGDQVCIMGAIVSVGDKIGVRPDSFKKEEGEMDEAETVSESGSENEAEEE